MRILISTGVYPPQIGGPAQYAKNLLEEFEKEGHDVSVAKYTFEKKLPVGLRHLVFFAKSFFILLSSDFAIALDTFSVGVPTIIASKLLRKKVIVRIAGDFLWESYVERTGNLILLRNFYTFKPTLSFKEKIIFWFSKEIIKKSDHIVFSTKWQRDIWLKPYSIDLEKTSIIENFFYKKEDQKYEVKNFIWPVRPLKLKNGRLLYRAFAEAKKKDSKLILDDGRYPHDELMKRIEGCYAVILPSISDVSPNVIIDAIAYGKPFIMTEESGYAEKFKKIGIFVNPLDENDIKEKILTLSDKKVYEDYKEKILGYSYKHSYRQIAGEYLKTFNSLKK